MGKGKKGKKKQDADPNALTEVDKTFYELQIADLNRKLARLRTLTEEQTVKNEELKEELTQLDSDRNDVIVFLKRMLQEKNDEMVEYQERITGLEETRSTETVEFNQKITTMEEEYKQMHEQLTSEIKLLTGKLNALEEFRSQRDDLMRKFETQEHTMEEQEQKHKRAMYEIERKFIIGKDRLKKDMEARLIQLSNEFQDVTEVRIASTTHRVIRENIAINNELDTMLATHQRFYNENERLKKLNKTLKLEAQLHEKEKTKALETVNVQHSIIEKFTEEHEKLTSKLKKLKTFESENFKLELQLLDLQRLNDKNKIEIRILEQNLHASRCDRTSLRTELNYVKDEVERLNAIIYHSVMSIKVALQLAPSEADSYIKHEGLLANLLNVMAKAQEEKPTKPSLESIGSLTAMYATGDLGFVPKPGPYRKTVPVRRNIEMQVGDSLEDLASVYVSEAESIDSVQHVVGTESNLLPVPGPKPSEHKELHESETSDEKLIFLESSEADSTISSEGSGTASLLKLEMSQMKAAAAASAAKVTEAMRQASRMSSIKVLQSATKVIEEQEEPPAEKSPSVQEAVEQQAPSEVPQEEKDDTENKTEDVEDEKIEGDTQQVEPEVTDE